MTPMTPEQRKIADAERPKAICARIREGGCSGRLEVSHPFGRRVQKRWMWIWCCHEHHEGTRKNEKIGLLHCYLQADDEEIIDTFPKTYKIYLQEKKWLKQEYRILWNI